ncbi:hypothetical protein PLCT1_02004 [Planctomycetaceae bacterium]|nr:hypothetical protein PLCT1_02004 [Planctomycetaceae bacterium]
MAKKQITINIDPIVEARVDTKTPHYWDVKRRRVLRGSDEEDAPGRTVLIDTIPARVLRKLITDFRKIVDTKDGKAIDEVLKAGLDRFPKLLEKSPELDKLWHKQAGRELARAAVDWLGMQGIENFTPSGAMSRYLHKKSKARDEEE